MVLSIAWKNVWRNKLRSTIVIVSIAVGLIGGVFYLAFVKGMVQQQVNSTIKTEVSNIQIHHPQFLVNEEIKFMIDNHEKTLQEIRKLPEVEAATSRIISPAMASSAITGTGIKLVGIDVKEEKQISCINSLIIKGTYFNTKVKNSAVIGEKLATKLKVKIKSKIVVTTQNIQGDIIYNAFRVVGIFKTHNTAFDQSTVFVLKKDLSKMLDFDLTKATEISVLLRHNKFTETVAKKIKTLLNNKIKQNKIVVQTWEDIRPALKMMNDMTGQITMIFVIIILVALSFGIINTMLMAIMERVREIGMLMAIGMNKGKIFLMILFETLFLSVTGGILGLLFSWILINITGITGIDLSVLAEGLNSMGYSSFVYPELDFYYYALIGLLVVATAVFASIMPARKALKFNPAEAVRHDA
jgi:ABC-type lipoprotein release transport system permease subunit